MNQLAMGKLVGFYQGTTSRINLLQHVALLGARLYVAYVFFMPGLTTIEDWDTTLWLFEEEYSVPLLNHEFAAFLATGGELILPVLLAIGLATRFSAMGLFIVNVVAVISLEDIAVAAYNLHLIWGILLANVFIFGAGYLSADKQISKYLTKPQS